MTASPFHLALFTNFRSPAEGGRSWSPTDIRSWTSGAFHVEMVQMAERARFDCVLIEDTSMIGEAYGGTTRVDLQYGLNSPKLDPLPLASVLGQATSHIGLLPTLSTSFYPPFLLARAIATCDHLTGGRAGWNIVTSSQDLAAQNYGMDTIPEHDLRYEIADEYVDLVLRLWQSWEPEAVVQDWDRGIYVDYERVHHVNFEGKYFRSRGPLNVPSPPQGRPVLCQAGQSPAGLAFAAKHADLIVAVPKGVAAMKATREQIRAKVAAGGREPSDCKVFFLVSPVVAGTMEDARALADAARRLSDIERIESVLGQIGGVTEIDFSQFELDAPLPTVSTEGHRGVLEEFVKMAAGRTLREVVDAWTYSAVELVGTASHVAGQMNEIMEEVGGDGFMFHGGTKRELMFGMTELLAPELQRMGLTRTEYSHEQFRDNLLAF